MRYTLILSKDVKGFGKPRIAAEPAMLAGHYDSVSKTLVRPCMAETRAILPHYYRKALDRIVTGYWYDKHDNELPCHLTLRDRRGKYLNTITAIPVRD